MERKSPRPSMNLVKMNVEEEEEEEEVAQCIKIWFGEPYNEIKGNLTPINNCSYSKGFIVFLPLNLQNSPP